MQAPIGRIKYKLTKRKIINLLIKNNQLYDPDATKDDLIRQLVSLRPKRTEDIIETVSKYIDKMTISQMKEDCGKIRQPCPNNLKKKDEVKSFLLHWLKKPIKCEDF